MRKLLFAIRDDKAECFDEPKLAHTRMEIMRSVEMALRDPNHPFSVNSNDFHLFEIGSYDMVTGKLEAHNSPVSVCGVWELLPQVRPAVVK